jgi:hypothetical protein
MAKLPDAAALGETPVPTLPRRTPMVATMRAHTGFEQEGARALAHAGAELGDAANFMAREKEQADTLAAEDAYNKLRTKQIDLTYGKDGFMNRRGADAVNTDLPVTYGKQFQSAAQDLAGSLSNDYQRQLFNRRASTSQLQVQEMAFRHVATEADVYAKEVFQGTLDTEARVSAATGDPSISIVRVNAAIDRHAQRFGLPEPEITSQKMKAADTLLTAAVKGAIGRDPLVAQAMFAAHETEIGPVNKPILEHELKVAVQPIQARAISDFVLGGRDPRAMDKLQKTFAIEGTPALMQVSQQLSQAQAPTKTRDTRAMLGGWLEDAAQIANSVKPNDPVFLDMVTQQVKNHVATIVAMQQGVQMQAQGTLISLTNGGADGKAPKPTTLDELMAKPGAREAYMQLDPAAASGIRSIIQHNAVEAAGGTIKADPGVITGLFNRIWAKDDDPKKITLPTELTQYFGKGLNQHTFDWLSGQLAKARSPEGSGFQRDLASAAATARRMILAKDLSGGIYRDQYEEAAFRFTRDLDSRADELRKAGKDPRTLLDPQSKDYALTPGRIGSFLPNQKQAIKDTAAAIKDAEPKPAAVNYVAGQTYKFKQGDMEFLGGNPDNASSWRKK